MGKVNVRRSKFTEGFTDARQSHEVVCTHKGGIRRDTRGPTLEMRALLSASGSD